ncbi:uncharacterized protein LOC124924903 [Impatiens glandulifera]|uniref:uncharacterized protein LOC124924903 n=1 Tax=Impatiens glandulifera TaxID=253017 RepID=UPI001FB05338|nr:uncharacterized protein LOC124924903 [Impatiens glandulifera]
MEDQQQIFKHFCRICKKGFMCGRALGGHMRAHGIGDESGNLEDDDDDDAASDWEDKADMNAPLSKRNYALRTNPNRLKTCRVCENCGKEFLCWKSFLEHGKCSSDDVESPDASSPRSAAYGEDPPRSNCQWSKRKRSFRAKIGNVIPASEEDDMAATCLVMLSNARVDTVDQPEESCASASREEERRNPEAAMAFFSSAAVNLDVKAKSVAVKGVFECKACKKVFNSHQALGGHRASHKKVKGCFAARLDNADELTTDRDEDYFRPSSKPLSIFRFDESGPSYPVGINSNNNNNNSSKRKAKVHECSICHRIFSSGQALGGHKRCHWITSNSSSETTKFHPFHQHNYDPISPPRSIPIPENNNNSYKGDGLELNLNLPASVADHQDQEFAGIRRDPRNTLSFEVSTDHHMRRLQAMVVGGDEDIHKEMNKEVELEKEMKMKRSLATMEMNEEDEAESKVKLAKLSELKDINVGGGGTSSPWLQVGIGSANNDQQS